VKGSERERILHDCFMTLVWIICIHSNLRHSNWWWPSGCPTHIIIWIFMICQHEYLLRSLFFSFNTLDHFIFFSSAWKRFLFYKMMLLLLEQHIHGKDLFEKAPAWIRLRIRECIFICITSMYAWNTNKVICMLVAYIKTLAYNLLDKIKSLFC